MADLNVTERRLRPILDAVASRNWKQALQQCDKWQKKGEKSDRFLALKASILVNQPDKSQVEKGKAETLQLCHRDPAVTDVEALYQLQDSLRHLSLHREEGPKLWERAISARPNDKDLLTTLLNGSISDDNWMSAQKAAMALRKAFPKERQYEFWNILLCYLIHEDTHIPQKDRDLFGRLAYMLMSKAADAVPINKDELLTTGKEIATPEEVALLVHIYKATGHADQAVKLLTGETLGLESRIARLDPQLTFSLLLEVLSVCDDKEQVFSICKDFISSGSSVSKQHQEDDRVWKIVQGVGKHPAATPELNKATLDLASSVFTAEPTCRAAYLAYFNLVVKTPNTTASDDTQSLLSACLAYYDNFSKKPFSFLDLVNPLLADRILLDNFLSQAKPEEGNDIQQALALKLRHTALATSNDSESTASYLKLATDAVRLHKRLPKDKSECPEMMLLAATSLLRLASQSSNSNYAIQASYILHNCYRTFNEYYPIAIRQIQIHVAQGQVSLAMEKFASLAVKNMQWETVGHLLLTRISTLHPLQSGGSSGSTNALSALDSGLTMLENADRTLDKAIHEGLKYGSFSNIIDSVNVKGNMARSLNRQIYIVEERRIQRTIGVPLDITLAPTPADMVDQRDFSFLPDFGNFQDRPAFENSLSCGPLPKKMWLTSMALHDHLATYLKAELASQSTLATSAYDRLKATLEKIKEVTEQWQIELTDDEISSLTCHQSLAETLILTKESPASKQADIDTWLDKLKSWLTNTIASSSTGLKDLTTTVNGVETPTWKFLHWAFTTLETIQSMSHFLALQARRTKTTKAGKAVLVPKDRLAELQQLTLDAEKAVHEQAKRLKDGIGASGVLGKLVDAAAGRVEDQGDEYRMLAEEYADLIVDEAALEEYCGRVKESWEDGLDGVLRVKVKVVK